MPPAAAGALAPGVTIGGGTAGAMPSGAGAGGAAAGGRPARGGTAIGAGDGDAVGGRAARGGMATGAGALAASTLTASFMPPAQWPGTPQMKYRVTPPAGSGTVSSPVAKVARGLEAVHESWSALLTSTTLCAAGEYLNTACIHVTRVKSMVTKKSSYDGI